MRIPKMKIEIARHLMDLGFSDVYQLVGRAPEILFEDLNKQKDAIPPDALWYFRMAVYYAENESPDPALMHPSAWQH